MGFGFRVWGLGFRVQGYVGLIGIGRHTETKHCWGFGVGVVFHGKGKRICSFLLQRQPVPRLGIKGLGSRV